MKIVSWNTNSRSNKEILKRQCDFLSQGKFDVITLQEITETSQIFFKDYFKNDYVLSSFDLSKDLGLLKRKRKYGQIIISKIPCKALDPYRINIPFPERILSVKHPEGFEIYTTHVPPGSSNGIIKVIHFEELFKYLKNNQKTKKILTGDFNSPKSELSNGEIITWGQKITKAGNIKYGINSKWKNDCTPERWDAAERGIIQNHHELGLIDVFRKINGYDAKAYSWYISRKNLQLGRRYDHIFCSDTLNPISCEYIQEPRLQGLSDHSPVISLLEIR